MEVEIHVSEFEAVRNVPSLNVIGLIATQVQVGEPRGRYVPKFNRLLALHFVRLCCCCTAAAFLFSAVACH